MKQHRHTWTVAVSLVVGLLAVPTVRMSAQTPPDNTKVNKQDRDKSAVTADQQKENATDRALTQKIRRSLLADKTLSTYAHNVKVVSQNGQVTLKGPVRTDAEKQAVEAKAREIAGADHVVDQMSVAPARQKTKQ